MRSREWNPKSFFRHLTPEVLKLLQGWMGVELQLDGSGPLGEQFYRAWKGLTDEERKRLETRLLPVNDMCSVHARSYLDGMATLVWTNGDAKLFEESHGWSVQDLALRLFIADEQRFGEVHQGYDVDTMEHLREYHGRYPKRPEPTQAAKLRMKTAMTEHFLKTAFGARCQVEDFANDEKFALFVLHEDEMTPLDRFNERGVVEPDWQRPVVRLAAIFDLDSSTLRVKAPRKEEREKLRELFAEIFIGDTDYFEDASRVPRFCFDPLRDPNFDFPTRGVDRITEVSVTRLLARSGNSDVKRVRLELKAGLSQEGLRLAASEHGVDMDTAAIDCVQLFFRFAGKGRSTQRSVTLTNPNTSTLTDTERDRVIQRYLREWGIDASGRNAMASVVRQAATG